MKQLRRNETAFLILARAKAAGRTIKQVAVAAWMGKSFRNFYHMVSGRRAFPASTWRPICDYLRISYRTFAIRLHIDGYKDEEIQRVFGTGLCFENLKSEILETIIKE